MAFKMKGPKFFKSALKQTESPVKHPSHSRHHPNAYNNLSQKQKDDPYGPHLGFAKMEQDHLDQSSHSHHHPKGKKLMEDKNKKKGLPEEVTESPNKQKEDEEKGKVASSLIGAAGEVGKELITDKKATREADVASKKADILLDRPSPSSGLKQTGWEEDVVSERGIPVDDPDYYRKEEPSMWDKFKQAHIDAYDKYKDFRNLSKKARKRVYDEASALGVGIVEYLKDPNYWGHRSDRFKKAYDKELDTQERKRRESADFAEERMKNR
jgi:hypothetical protein